MGDARLDGGMALMGLLWVLDYKDHSGEAESAYAGTTFPNHTLLGWKCLQARRWLCWE
jgi:hypothetical protein